jgi:hypothetical protein
MVKVLHKGKLFFQKMRISNKGKKILSQKKKQFSWK